jgi:type IV secretory pathway VirB10-like protein
MSSHLPPFKPTSLERAANPWVVPLGVAGAVGAGFLVFATLNARRETPPSDQVAAPAFETPPPPLAPLENPAQSVPYMEDDRTGIVAPHMAGLSEQAGQAAPDIGGVDPDIQRRAAARDQRWRSPSLIVDLSAGAAAPNPALAATASLANPALAAAAADGDKNGRGGDEAFARRLAAETTGEARSSRLSSPGLTAPQGTIVPAVLETAINSDLPGFVRAVVSRDVRAFDGRTVIIPRGSKLVGQYRNGVAAGQSRAFVVWTRLLRPDGVTIDLGSPAADALGRGGLQGKTDQHFLQRFGAAILLSVVSGVTTSRGSGDTVVIGSAQDANRIAEIALQRQIDIPPTIKVAQGAPIRVFVARDLVFESAAR